MKDEDSIFGAKPDRLNKLVFQAMEDSASDEPATGTASLNALVEQLGSQIGCYKLLRVLGEGGMGIVYLAEQVGQIRRKVALKVIKPGMDSKRVVARFETERQALALLDHANIAQVYDAGTTETGRPYFVMEHVKGSPITEYCDHHKLSIEDRLVLFQQVCQAVHHAHQKGIIHRDIKPSNILVSTEGDKAIPKIIDFGVAKAISQPLTDRTLFTEDSQLLGTPEYMSPEQAEMSNEDIDTRSDIYSLGILLYVVLAGILPYDSQTFRRGGVEHIRKTIRETDPKTPSTRLTKLGEEARKVAENRRTELATLAKCLHRELEWIPLKAMRKDRSERYRSAVELADDIGNYLNGAPLMAGPPTTVYRLKKFVRRNSRLSAAVLAVAVALILGLAATAAMYLRAEVALDKAEVALDKEARALAQAQEATELAKQTAEDARQAAELEAAARAEAQRVTNFLNYIVLGSASKIKGREATVIDVLNPAVAKLDEGFLYYQPLTEASIRRTLAQTYYDLGYYAVAAQHQKPVHPIYAEHFGENHLQTNIALNWIAVYYYHAGRYREAEPLYRQIIDKTYQHETGPLVEKRLNWNANFAATCAGLGRYEEAEQLLLPNVEDHLWVGYGLHLGEIYREQGRYQEAERVLLDSLDAGRKEKAESKNVQHYGCMVRCMHELALLRLAQGRYKEAEELFEQGIDLGTRELPGKDHPYTLRHVNGLAIIRIKQQCYEDAKTLLERAFEGRKLKLGEDHPNTIRTTHYLGVLQREQGEYDKAENFLIEARKKRQTTLGEDHPHTLTSMHELAALYKDQACYDEAEKWLLEAVKGRQAKLGDQHPHTQESIKTLIDLYEASNRPERADEWRSTLPSRGDAEKRD